jgi:hypothetical protein
MEVCKRKRLFERGDVRHPLTAHKVCLLRMIAECSVLTLPQLARFAGISEKSARDHARDLFDLGLVARTGVPRAALAATDAANASGLLYGSSPTIYSLSPAGAKLLTKAGLLDRDDGRELPHYGPKNALFLAHELMVRDVRVWLECLSRAHGHPGAALWRDGPQAAIGPTRPDALFVYRLSEATLVGLVEVDRATERAPARWEAKFRQYERLFASRAIEELTGHERGRVIVTVPDARRRDTIAAILERMLMTSHAPPERFWITEHSTLERTDLREAVWRVAGREGLLPLVPERFL